MHTLAIGAGISLVVCCVAGVIWRMTAGIRQRRKRWDDWYAGASEHAHRDRSATEIESRAGRL